MSNYNRFTRPSDYNRQPEQPAGYGYPPVYRAQPTGYPDTQRGPQVGYGGIRVPVSNEQLKSVLISFVGAINESVKVAIDTIIRNHIQGLEDIRQEVKNVNTKGYELLLDYIPNSNTNPNFSICCNLQHENTRNPNQTKISMKSFGTSNANINRDNSNYVISKEELTATEEALNDIVEKFDRIVHELKSAGVADRFNFEYGNVSIAVVNGTIFLTPSTLVLNSYKRDNYKQAHVGKVNY